MPIEKSMLTIRDLYMACQRYKSLRQGTKSKKKLKTGEKDPRYDIAKRASTGMLVTRIKVIEEEDEDGDIYRKVTCIVKDTKTTKSSFHGLINE